MMLADLSVLIVLIIMQLDVIVYCRKEMGSLLVLAAGKWRRGATIVIIYYAIAIAIDHSLSCEWNLEAGLACSAVITICGRS